MCLSKSIRTFLSLFLLFSFFFSTTEAESIPGTHSKNEVTLYYFWSRYCSHCKQAKSFVNNLPKTYPWLTLHSYDLVDSRINQKRFLLMAKQLHQPANSVPGFIFCGQMMVGYDRAETTGQELEQKLLACHQQKNSQKKEIQEDFNIPWLGKIHYQDLSLPVFTLVIAALDAFNPCAFFILFFLLSIMTHQRKRLRMLVRNAHGITSSTDAGFLFVFKA